MTSEALLGAGPLDAVIARRDGVAIDRRQYLADAGALAERLPASGAMLNLSSDRYRFAVGLGAALLRGHACLLPPNHTPHTVARLRARFPDAYALVEVGGEGDGLPCRRARRTKSAPKFATGCKTSARAAATSWPARITFNPTRRWKM